MKSRWLAWVPIPRGGCATCLHGTRQRYCQECGEPLDGAANFGTDAEPLCGLCPARRRLGEMWRQGVALEQITALQRVWRQGFTREQITALQRVKTREGEDAV